jgi:hypothetical protein
MSRRARWEVLMAVYPRYRGAARVERGRILNEFCDTTGYQRKYALRVLVRNLIGASVTLAPR